MTSDTVFCRSYAVEPVGVSDRRASDVGLHVCFLMSILGRKESLFRALLARSSLLAAVAGPHGTVSVTSSEGTGARVLQAAGGGSVRASLRLSSGCIRTSSTSTTLSASLISFLVLHLVGTLPSEQANLDIQ